MIVCWVIIYENRLFPEQITERYDKDFADIGYTLAGFAEKP